LAATIEAGAIAEATGGMMDKKISSNTKVRRDKSQLGQRVETTLFSRVQPDYSAQTIKTASSQNRPLSLQLYNHNYSITANKVQAQLNGH
jgi:hypothetical protein